MSKVAAKPKLMSLDFAILSALPDEGAKFGYHDLGMQVKAIVRNFNADQPDEAPRLTGAQINGRMRALKLWGYVVDVTVSPIKDGRGWQITEKGKAVLNGRGS